jgi:exopolysaccharide biosynthesis predicted pyruvyltransferase EpsI
MDLKQAKELVKHDFDNYKIIVVTSKKAVFFLENENELSNLEEYAKNNNLELFVVKNEVSEESSEDKPKKKK